MRALVTGGAGFVGSALVDRLLAEGHSVDVVDDLSGGSLANLASARSGHGHALSFHHLDLCSSELRPLVLRRRPEVVFHLAATAAAASLLDPVGDARTNVVGSLALIDAAKECGAKKVVFASSGSELYGRTRRGDPPAKESQPLHPLSLHGVAKKAVADYLAFYRDRYDLEFSALAMGEVYGPRQQPGRLDAPVADFASRLAAGEICTAAGNGTDSHDFVYVDDVVDALARAARRGGGLLLNVATGTATSVNELYSTVARATGSDLVLRFDADREPAPKTASLDPSRAGIHLGWKPWTALADGVAAVVEWSAAAGHAAT